jgi:hypothetical protein
MINEEDVHCAPEGGPWKRRLLGYVIPTFIVGYALIGFVEADVDLFVRHPIDFTGLAARLLAISYLAVAAFMHFHWGWGLSQRLWPHSQRYKYFAIACFVPFFVLANYLKFAL